jgi:hypothetical protein
MPYYHSHNYNLVSEEGVVKKTGRSFSDPAETRSGKPWPPPPDARNREREINHCLRHYMPPGKIQNEAAHKSF